VYAKAPGFVATGGDHAPIIVAGLLMSDATNDEGLAAKTGIAESLYGNKKGVEVEMEYGAHVGLLKC